MSKMRGTPSAMTHRLYARSPSALEIRGRKVARLMRRLRVVAPWLEPSERVDGTRLRKRAHRADDRGAEIGAGRGDDPGGERRRVEPMIDGRDEIFFDRGGTLRARHRAMHHVQVVRRIAKIGIRRDRFEPLPQPPQRTDQRRYHRVRRHIVFVTQCRVRPHRETDEIPTSLRTTTPWFVTRRAARTWRPHVQSTAGRRRPQPGWCGVARCRPRTPTLSQRCRKPTVERQIPHVFERPRPGQVDGAVLAVVVEAFKAADVADGRVGDDDTFETFGDLVGPAPWRAGSSRRGIRSHIDTMPTSFRAWANL